MNISIETVCHDTDEAAHRSTKQCASQFDHLSPRAQKTIQDYALRRGIQPCQFEQYLHPKLDLRTEEPPGLRAAVDFMLDSLKNRASILIYGDYDCDGISSTASLIKFFQDCTTVHPAWQLPDRQKDQYGLTATKAAELLANTHCDVLVALDCGTNSAEALELLHAHGVKTLVIDHHPAEQRTTRPTVMLNPNADVHACENHQALCTCGLVLLFCAAVARALGTQCRWDRRFAIAVSALATLADACVMTPLNRSIIRTGLMQFDDPVFLRRNPGFSALIRETGADGINQSIAQFQLIPRINALGRLASPEPGVELLVMTDPANAAQIASLASGFNKVRQELQQRIVCSALEQTREFLKLHPNLQLLVLADSHWHHGVVGPPASRVVEACGRSAVLLGLDSSGIWRGSGRAHSTHDLGQFVRTLKATGQIMSGGGHAAAVGLTLTDPQLQALKTSVLGFIVPTRGNCEIESEIVGEFCELPVEEWAMVMGLLAPFGAGNPKPLVRAVGCRLICSPSELRTKDGRIWALRGEFRAATGQTIRVLCTKPEALGTLPWKAGDTFDLLLELNSRKQSGREYHDLIRRG